MEYTRKDYEEDLKSEEIQHTKSREHFEAFYNELGLDPVQLKQKYKEARMNFVIPKGRIIELGCHIGFNCIKYALAGFDVLGVDISRPLIEKAWSEVERYFKLAITPVQIRFLISWIEDLKVYELGRFDTVILTETLEHVIDPAPVLKKAWELLEEDGTLYISCPATKFGTNSHVRGITVKEMHDLIYENCQHRLVTVSGNDLSKKYIVRKR